MADGVTVHFLNLRKLGAELDRSAAVTTIAGHEFSEISVHEIATRAKSKAQQLGSVAALASQDIRVLGSKIVYGGKGYDMGAEYGSRAYRQFMSYNEGGYFLGDAEENADLEAKWDAFVWGAIKSALKV